ncbi:acyltransferase [Nostoc sp. CENA67]|uniref:Acyltransferase n=1 Tax=Amazonocrinis nigriterrae CENA67 TaxID=2794033 RepID=A0A8J7L722_9NOST|nr:acyltransferase [Amazonocrinis nigriterrae]MBH8561893.1 acyltransferase [Amazonocrinis nigriterrae CENA67]
MNKSFTPLLKFPQFVTNDEQNTVVNYKPRQYMPQLDGLRALAIFAVFIEHYLEPSNPIRTFLPWGWLGVRVFFVLSGFLITGILLKSRQEYEAGNISYWQGLKNFFMRRFLRLSPVYFIYLITSIFIFPGKGKYLWVFILYGQNWLFALEPTMVSRAHLWSLAVEAQFYLIMPLILMFLPVRSLLPITIGLVMTSPILRGIGIVYHLPILQAYQLPFNNFDTLAMGAILALLHQYHFEIVQKFLKVALCVGIPLLSGCFILLHFPLQAEVQPILVLFMDVVVGIAGVAIVGYTAQGIKGLLGEILHHPWLVYSGQISYGLYVYHGDIPEVFFNHLLPLLSPILPPITPPIVPPGYIAGPWFMFPVYVAIAYAIAAFSWQFIEQPIHRLKYRFR